MQLTAEILCGESLFWEVANIASSTGTIYDEPGVWLPVDVTEFE